MYCVHQDISFQICVPLEFVTGASDSVVLVQVFLNHLHHTESQRPHLFSWAELCFFQRFVIFAVNTSLNFPVTFTVWGQGEESRDSLLTDPSLQVPRLQHWQPLPHSSLRPGIREGSCVHVTGKWLWLCSGPGTGSDPSVLDQGCPLGQSVQGEVPVWKRLFGCCRTGITFQHP